MDVAIKNHKTRLIATDVDGTFLDSKHKVSARTLAAVRSLPDTSKCHLIFATGKTRAAVAPLLIDTPAPSVNLNGGITYAADGSILVQHFIDSEIVANFLEYGAKVEVCVVAYSGDDIYAIKESKWIQWLAGFGEPVARVDPNLIDKVRKQEIPVHKLIFLDEASSIPALRRAFASDAGISRYILSEEKSLEQSFIDGSKVFITQAVSQELEVMPSGCSKAVALMGLCERLGIKSEEVVAFGDGDNDVHMLRWAGLSFAMGNAMPKPMASADFTTARNDDDGFAAVVEKIVATHFKE